MRNLPRSLALVLASIVGLTSAIALDVNNVASIKKVASTIAYGMMKYYTGNVTNTPTTIGVLPKPYYWWESGAMWGAMLDYYHMTNDTTYNLVTTQALLSQVGPKYDYMVPLHELDEGNDDQAFWGFATMRAAEMGYPQPTTTKYTWLQLTENLWNTQVPRWNTTACGGGLKWQIFPFNNGYTYRNSVSNGAFFQLAARLARFTGNQTYVHWAEKSYNWTRDIGLISPEWLVFDGTDDKQNCTRQNRIVWTYNNAIFLYGSATMYNYTNGSTLWRDRTQGFLKASFNFFTPFNNATNIMFEPACETVHTCNTDQFSFKAYLSRFMYATTQMAPFTRNAILSLLTPSAQAAANSCSGGTDGVTCGTAWYVPGWDGKYGVGQQMSSLETIHGLLVDGATPPIYNSDVHLRPAGTSETSVSTSLISQVPVPTAPAPAATTSTLPKNAAVRGELDWRVLALGTVIGYML